LEVHKKVGFAGGVEGNSRPRRAGGKCYLKWDAIFGPLYVVEAEFFAGFPERSPEGMEKVRILGSLLRFSFWLKELVGGASERGMIQAQRP
jgi:hypothetical protein